MTAEIAPATHNVAIDMECSKAECSTHLEHAKGVVPSEGEVIASAGSPRNPRNWPLWKKNIQIMMVAFHSMMDTFTAAGIIPAYEDFARVYNVSMPVASYLTSSRRVDALLIIWLDSTDYSGL